MLVAVQSKDRLLTAALPSEVEGARWLVDVAGRKLAHAVGRGGWWYVEPCEGLRVRGSGGSMHSSVEIDPSKLAVVNLDDREGGSWCLVFHPDTPQSVTNSIWGFSGERDISIGRSDDNDIVYPCSFVSGRHAKLSYRNGSWLILDLGSSNGMFLNGRRIEPGKAHPAAFGDAVDVFGLRITLGAGFFSCNNPEGSLRMADQQLVRYRAIAPEKRGAAHPAEEALFYPALRFARAVEKKSFVVDAPPQPEREDETSLAMRIGPSLIMAFASVMSAAVFVSMMSEQGSSMLRAVPMVTMAVAMLAGSVLWPVLNARTQNKNRAKKEARRRAAYSQYINKVRSELAAEAMLQKDILTENRVSVQECLQRALVCSPNLMNRTALHADYLDVRLGVGEESFVADLRFPDQHFSMDDDDLREAVDALAKEPRLVRGVPLVFPIVSKHVMGVVGSKAATFDFARGMIVQVAALCSYEDVKIVVLCDEEDRDEWSFALHLPHCFSDTSESRYFACGAEEAAELGLFMERVLESRRSVERFEARDAHPYYVVLCASETLADRADIVRAIVRERANWGVSLISLAREMKDLPKECRSVVGLDGASGYLLERDDPSGRRRLFAPDIAVSAEVAQRFSRALSRVRLDLAAVARKMPERLGFFEMFGIANADHLNIAERWRVGNASNTLSCYVGVDELGEPFALNLHEKFHGPHGLIAGTTGSGKSEFIITYILSMAMTYSPNEVAFVLIDYKGGGLAKAFDNEHVRLPHLAGVITNLDGAAITRSLVSINSELKRRQALFNRARDVVGGDSVDIYGYLNLFRQGKMDEPCPHLFIVADEFAELKQQEPEFMDELISAARIGRSLGVHLILATQKPSGVVNDQIWSNARFKVCLKVADSADSTEMIKRPDAAELSQAGRFYLLVGYNEYFALGQAAYAGARYVEREQFEPERDDAVTLISDTGRSLVSIKPRKEGFAGDGRPESVVLLQRIGKTADALGLHARQLWLEPIPAAITVEGLERKYAGWLASESRNRLVLNPLVGEIDDPEHQRQLPLRLPLTAEGNALFYGLGESGVETLLGTMVFSLLRAHDAASLRVYILDFGSESLRAFAAAPQVGDVICAGEDEKVMRFFDFAEAEIAARRRKLAAHGGSLLRYAESHDDTPALLFVLNDTASFVELYPRLEERLAKLTRDTGRGGVHLVMTGASTSSVRLGMRMNFRQVLAVNMADAGDYGLVFGSMRGVPVPHGHARGLARHDGRLLEFQGAHASIGPDEFGDIARFCASLQETLADQKKVWAPPIPTVPQHVAADDLLSRAVPLLELPYGIYEDTLEVAAFDFEEAPIRRCVFQKRKTGAPVIRAIAQMASRRPGWECAVLDFDGLLGDERPEGCTFATRKDDLAMGYVANLVNFDIPEKGKTLLVVVTGIAGFTTRLAPAYASDLRSFLRDLPAQAAIKFLLADAVSSATYSGEEWFKLQVGLKEGLWIGPGADSQSSIGISYNGNKRLTPDSQMKDSRGFAVDAGDARLVRLVELEANEDKEDER